MHIISCCRCCDHKDQICQGAVKCLIIHAFRNYHCCKSRFFYCLYLCVWDGNSFTNGCTSSASLAKIPSLYPCVLLSRPPASISEISLSMAAFLSSHFHAQFNAFLFNSSVIRMCIPPSIFQSAFHAHILFHRAYCNCPNNSMISSFVPIP